MRTWLVALALWLLAAPAPAAVIAYVVAPASAGLGSQFDVELRATLGDPTLGWGVDLGYDASKVQLVSGPTIGSDWTAVAASDGDGLAGVALGAGLTGDHRLAVLRFQAIAQGSASFVLSETVSDLSEGFALDPTGFAQVTYQGATVNIVPEPATGLLSALGFAGLAAARRTRARATAQANSSSRSDTTRR
ncbi:MAG TPA: cohesin domain-containing protein [Myxococcota bacterium]|nr:cohesin domain-containing protein [Myxococcota bacterium]